MQRLHRILLCAVFLTGGTMLAQAPGSKEIKAHEALVYSLAFSPDGKLLASAGFDGLVKIWEFDPSKGELKEKLKLTGHAGPVYCVSYNKDGSLLASSSQDKTIRLWTPADGKMQRELKGHGDIVDNIAFSPDGKLLASASADKSVRLWNPADGKEVKNLGSHAKSVYAVSFSPDGKQLASAGADNIIKIYDLASQKELKQLKGHTEPVTGIAFTPDGKGIASISQDRSVRVWDVASGKETKVLGPQVTTKDEKTGKATTGPGPNEDDLYGIAFVRNGKALATSGYGGWLKVWDIDAGKPTFSQKLKAFGAYCVTFTPDGKALITGHDNHNIYITPLGK
ncbi:MAG: WD40 repeat domain-containing protein [Gemmataceae bacterium]